MIRFIFLFFPDILQNSACYRLFAVEVPERSLLNKANDLSESEKIMFKLSSEILQNNHIFTQEDYTGLKSRQQNIHR